MVLVHVMVNIFNAKSSLIIWKWFIFFVQTGDSGGPLYVFENSRQIVAGIASYVIGGCAIEIMPGVTLPA